MRDVKSFCEELVREEDHDRFLAALFAPAAARPWLYALYAFDIETARVISRVNEPLAGEIRLQWWRDVVSGAGGDAAGSPVATSLIALIEQFPDARERLIGVIEARREQFYDQQDASSSSFEELAARSDGVIFELSALMLGVATDNIVEVLSRHAGIAHALTRRAAMQGQVDERAATEAEQHLDEVAGLLISVPAQAWPGYLVLALARPILRSLERRGHAGVIPRWRRQWLLWRASRHLAARI